MVSGISANISSLPDFLRINSGCGAVIRAVGCCGDYENSIRQLDREMICGCRVTAFPPLPDSSTVNAAVEKYRAVMEGNFPDKRFSEALKNVIGLEKSVNSNYNATIEKNLAASLIFWHGTLLPEPSGGRGKFVCSGNIRRREYLFCLLAAETGYDVMILLPGGDISLPPVLASRSAAVTLGSCRDAVIPGYSPAVSCEERRKALAGNIPAVNAFPGHHAIHNRPGSMQEGQPQNNSAPPLDKHTINLNHPKRAPLHSQQSDPVTGNIFQGSRTAAAEQNCRPRSVSPGYRQGNNSVSPARPDRSGTPVNITHPNRTSTPMDIAHPNRAGAAVNASRTETHELTYEQLALLAESVVMIELEDEHGNLTGSGSGVAISRDGYILTNCHVAGHGCAYRVRLENDDKIYRTTSLIKYHPLNDLAVIRIDRLLSPLRIFDGSRELARGQRVVAIGSPKGLFNSVSDGIISGFRVINDVDMIQFTAPISGGSSGGALLDMHGRVIGICTATLEDAQNINIAVSYKQIIPFCGGFIK